jgi:hypothetical protein
MSNSDHPFMRATISISSVVICLFLASCEKHPESAPTGATISASPNPVPTGSGTGTTTVSWTTGDGSAGQVYISANGQAEKLWIDKIPQGSGDAPWIQAGSSYEFRLYDAAHAKLLSKVVVTRAEH